MELCSGTPTKQTNSSTCILEELPNTRQRSNSQTLTSTQSDIVGSQRPTRFRRSSFILSGERQTDLDNLVASASREASTAAAAQEAATLSAFASPPPEQGVKVHDNAGEDSKRVSLNTIVASQASLTTGFCSDSTDKSSRTVVPCQSGRNLSIDRTPTSSSDSFMWHNVNMFTSNPLTSEVIQNYLAAISVDQEAEESELPPSPPKHPITLCENVPGIFNQSVASMTMPVQQIMRAHMNTSNSSSFQERGKRMQSLRHDKPHAFTDYLNSSSCASDVEAWPYRSRGYVSDNPIDEADPQAKQLRLAGQRLEADFNRASKSLPRSPKQTRKQKGGPGIAEALVGFGTSPKSRTASNFDLARIYDGLPQPKVSVSTNSLNEFQPFQSTVTPPSTPNSSLSVSSIGHDSGSSGGGLGRFISLLGPFKPKSADKDDSGSYIYMDEKTSERRANARASNVISPVSF